MDFWDVLRHRRSIRKFTTQEVEDEKLVKLLEAAFLSPSSHDKRPWHFIVVKQRETLDKLSESKNGAQGLHNAQASIVVCANSEISDVWIEDAAIAAHNINMAAVSLGLGSFWVQIRNRMHNEEMSAEDYVRHLLSIPANIKVLSIIGLGYPLKKKPPKEAILDEKKISSEIFSKIFKLTDKDL